LTFGELDTKDNVSFVEQHTAIAVPWLQAKLMHHFLTLQLGVFELAHGPIPIPPAVMPPEPVLPEGILKDDHFSIRVFNLIKETRERLVAEQPKSPA
jgi:hypothetical protein